MEADKLVSRDEMFPNTHGTLVTPVGVFEVRGCRCSTPQEVAAQNVRLVVALKSLEKGNTLLFSAEFWLKSLAVAPSGTTSYAEVYAARQAIKEQMIADLTRGDAPHALTDTTRDLMWLVPGKGDRFVVMAVRIPAGQWAPGAMVRATVEGRAVLIPPAELVYYTPPDAAPNVGAAVQGDTQETIDMNPSEPAPVLANLAESINAAFGPPLRASVESGRLVLRTRDVEAHIDASGELQTAMDTARCPTDADAPHVAREGQ